MAQIERALKILELLADHPGGMALGDIAEGIGVPKSATHRIVTSLVASEFALQDPSTQRYSLSVLMAALGFRYMAGSGLVEFCQPELDRLAQETGEFVRLAVVNGERLIFVAEAQGAKRGLRYEGEHGRREVRLHATATGKAWLATLPDDEAVRLVLQRGFDGPDQTGPKAIQNIPALLTELARTRRQGFSTAFDEGDPGVAAVAAAIIPGSGQGASAVGTIAVIGPTARLTRGQMMGMGPLLIASANRLARLWPFRGVTGNAAHRAGGA